MEPFYIVIDFVAIAEIIIKIVRVVFVVFVGLTAFCDSMFT